MVNKYMNNNCGQLLYYNKGIFIFHFNVIIIVRTVSNINKSIIKIKYRL